MAETLFYDAAAQADFPVIEDGGLARGHRSLLLVEDDPDGLIIDGLDQAGRCDRGRKTLVEYAPFKRTGNFD